MPQDKNKPTEAQLEDQIIKANQAYSQGMPFLTDDEYHEIWCQLRAINPSNSCLYHTSKDPNLQPGNIHHRRPILGMSKAFDMEDMKIFLARYGSDNLLVQPKYDGVGAVIYQRSMDAETNYQLVLFGDGTTGRDITHHLEHIDFAIEDQDQVNVELVIPLDQWDDSYGSNPRNTVAGWINSGRIPHPGVIEAMPHEHGPFEYQLCPPYDLEEMHETLLHIYNGWKDHYPIDGLIIKLASPTKRIAVCKADTPTYQWCIAWKPPIQTEWTTVTDIIWDVSRTGRIIPVVQYEEISLCGTLNTRVTGNNAKWLADKGVCVGSEILVGKAGEIIPKILEVKSDDSLRVEIPTECPLCHSELLEAGVNLICRGESCRPQLIKQIAYFYGDTGMNIKTIGPNTISRMLHNSRFYEVLSVSPWALLDPDSYQLKGHIFILLGQARAETFMNALEDVRNSHTEAHFISALGLPGLGYNTTLKLFHMIRGQKAYRRISAEALNSFTIGIKLLAQAKEEMKGFKLLPAPSPPKYTYTITGELSQPRQDFIDYLDAFGFQFTNTVSSLTNFVIKGQLKHETTKIRKAKEQGLPILQEEDIENILKENDNGERESTSQV